MRVTTADDLSRMMGKFRGKVDFSDSPNGFFGFVRETFEQLAKEEEHAADLEDVDIPNYPSFGHKDDDYDGVVRDFYSIWTGFATAKSFAWLDVYRLSEAPDRRTRRLMEKENQKFRDDGRREFNDAVRTLVAFVRKRDPRYTPSTQSDEQKAKAQRDARKAQAARARAEKLAKLDQEAQALPSWATARHAEDDDEEETEEEIEEEHYECVACNKTFKSERQYEAHERSKKHQKAIQALKRKMQKDNAHLDLDKDAMRSDVIMPADDDQDLEAGATGSDNDGSDDAVADLTGKTDELELSNSSSGEDQLNGKDPASASASSKNVTGGDSDEDEDDELDDEYASRSDIEARLTGNSSIEPSRQSDTPNTEPAESENSSAPIPKLGKAAQKRAKRAAKQAEVDQSDLKNKCLGCDAAFPSKTQLHQHLHDHPKHAALKSVAGGKAKKRGKK